MNSTETWGLIQAASVRLVQNEQLFLFTGFSKGKLNGVYLVAPKHVGAFRRLHRKMERMQEVEFVTSTVINEEECKKMQDRLLTLVTQERFIQVGHNFAYAKIQNVILKGADKVFDVGGEGMIGVKDEDVEELLQDFPNATEVDIEKTFEKCNKGLFELASNSLN